MRRLTLDRVRENEETKFSCGPKKHRQCFKADDSGYQERNCSGNTKKPLYGWAETKGQQSQKAVGGQPYGHHFVNSVEDSLTSDHTGRSFGQRVDRGPGNEGLRVFPDRRIGYETEAEQTFSSRRCFEGSPGPRDGHDART